MLVAGLRTVEVAPVAGFADVVELEPGFPDTDLRRLDAPPALDPAAAVEEEAVAEGRNDEVEGFFAGTAPAVSVLPDPVGVFRAIVEAVVGLALVAFGVVDGLVTVGLEVVADVRTVEEGRALGLDGVEPGRGARGVIATGGLPMEPVVGLGFGTTAAAVGGLAVEAVEAEGRALVVVVGLVREVAGFFGLAGGFLDGADGADGADGSEEVLGAGSSAAGGASGCSVSGVGGTSFTSGTCKSDIDNWTPLL